MGWIRRATFIISASGMNAKEIQRKFPQMWPDDDEGPIKVPERALEQLRKFREAEVLKRAKKKLDAR